jgi:hypothetical protein
MLTSLEQDITSHGIQLLAEAASVIVVVKNAVPQLQQM